MKDIYIYTFALRGISFMLDEIRVKSRSLVKNQVEKSFSYLPLQRFFFTRQYIDNWKNTGNFYIYIYFHRSPNNINFQKFLGNIRDTTWNSNIYNVINTLLVSPVSLYSNFISLLLFQHSTLDKIVTKHFPENWYFHRYAPLLPHRVNSDIEISIQTKCFLCRI